MTGSEQGKMLTRGSTCQNLFCAMDEEMHLSLFPSPFVRDAHTASQQAVLSSRGWPSVTGALPPPSLSSPTLRLPPTWKCNRLKQQERQTFKELSVPLPHIKCPVKVMEQIPQNIDLSLYVSSCLFAFPTQLINSWQRKLRKKEICEMMSCQERRRCSLIMCRYSIPHGRIRVYI